MVSNIGNHFSLYFESHVMPRHSRQISFLQVSTVVANFNKVFNSNVVVVNSRIHCDIVLVYGMVFGVVPTVTEIKASHEGDLLVYYHGFFMVAPKLWQKFMRMAFDCNIRMKLCQSFLRVIRIIRNYRWGEKNYNINFDAPFSNPFQKIIQPILVDCQLLSFYRPNQIKLWRNPPAANEYISFSLLKRKGNFNVIAFGVHQKINFVILPWAA